MYHPGNRALQERFGSTALADRLFDKLHRERFNEADKQFIESRTSGCCSSPCRRRPSGCA